MREDWRKTLKRPGKRPSEGARPWIVSSRLALLSPLYAAVVACGPVGDAPGGLAEEATAAASSAIYAGVADNDAQQNPSVVALKVGDGQQFELCSGALVAPNVVLTARHCVSTEVSTSVSCDKNGASLSGANFGADQPLASIHVLVGATPNLLGTPDANAKALYYPPGTTLCNEDIALVLLDRNVTSVSPMRVRLSSPVAQGESVRSVGFGQNDQNQPIGTRFRKDGVSILAVGSTVSSSQTALAGNEFEVGESICQGDSGGPAISEKTGAIVGIVSRGGACTDTFGHVYTSLAGFQSVFQQAFAVAGGAPIDENAPQPPPDAGSTGGDGGTVGSSSGSGGGSGGATSSGGTRYNGDVNLHSGQGKGCSTAPRAPARNDLAAGALAVVALVFARRRSRQ